MAQNSVDPAKLATFLRTLASIGSSIFSADLLAPGLPFDHAAVEVCFIRELIANMAV